uniref:uncharacterized protein n=1 Tax=Centroberyx gerrardi TaxID=166262 RepID=UPI003AACBCED
MPNIRQLRKRERKTRKWTPEAMEQAMQEVEAGRLTCRQAAKRFGVPKSSLNDRVSGRVASGCVHGQRPLLAPEDENSLVEYCLYSASHGFPLTKPHIQAHALAIYNRRHPNAQKTAVGQTWWINFRERYHHRLTAWTPDIIDHGRASCAKRGSINEYFRLLTATLEEHELREKPRQIYNCDETGFQLDSMRRKVIVPRGTKHAYRQAQGTRDHITILACFNAAGEDVPPFVIYKGGYPGGPYNKEGVPDALYGKSPAGYMDGELFRKWFVGHFLKFAAQERPLLLIMDGHKSHLDPELVRVAQREGVILLCLPPHTSHILQPLDVSFFGPLKADFSGLTGDLSAVSHSFLVPKKEFSRVLRDSYQRLKDRRVVVAGFRRCGLYPLDPMAIDWSRVMPSGPRRGTSSPPLPTPSASSWATPDATHPIQPPLSPVAPPPSRRMSLRAAPATSSGLPIAGPSTPLAPSCASHGPRLPAPSGTPSPTSLPVQDHQHHPPSPGGQADASNQASVTLSSSSSSSAGSTTSTGHTAGKRRQEPTVWRCGRCRKPDPLESSEGLVSWVQCDNCHKWFHTISCWPPMGPSGSRGLVTGVSGLPCCGGPGNGNFKLIDPRGYRCSGSWAALPLF